MGCLKLVVAWWAVAGGVKGIVVKALRGRRVLFGAVLAVVWLAVAARAEAKVVVSDDAMYSVDLGAATVCFIEPRELRADEDCAGVDVAAFPAPVVGEPLTRLAHGLVRGPGDGAARSVVGVVTMLRAPSHATLPPDQAAADQLGAEASASLAASLPAGAHLEPATSKIAWGKDVPVVRTTLVVSGLEAGSGAGVNDHREVLTAVGNRYLYMTVWSGSRDHAHDLARLADAAAATTDLKPQGRPVPNLNPWPGRLLFLFGILGLILLRFRLHKKKRPPPPPRS